jgi:hypothetical protein
MYGGGGGGAFVGERPSLFNAFDQEYFIVDYGVDSNASAPPGVELNSHPWECPSSLDEGL